MILGSETTMTDAAQMLDFYKHNFAVVEVVSCSKCGALLAFECSGGDGMGLAPNELGKYVIPVGDALLSSRVRLDEAPTGERMMGYQCGNVIDNPNYEAEVAAMEKAAADYEKQFKKDTAAAKKAGTDLPPYLPPLTASVPLKIECGNDTRIAAVERGQVPVAAMQVALTPFQKHQIREKIRSDRNYKADFKKVGNVKHFESFQVERV